MTHLERAIKESKEREGRIMNIPFENHDEIRNLIGANILWERKWRQVVEIAVDALKAIEDLSPLHERERRDISRRALLVIECLAKEGL